VSRSDEKPDEPVPAPVEAEVAAATVAPDAASSGSVEVAVSNDKLAPATSG